MWEFVQNLLMYCGRKVKVSSQENMDSSTVDVEANGPQRESKLELFGFDSLVNILGLKRYLLYCLLFTMLSFVLYYLDLLV